MAFKFENILSFRKSELDKCYMEQSIISGELVKLNMRINGAKESLNVYRESYGELVSNIADLGDYNLLESEYRSLLKRLENLAVEKESAEKRLEAKKAETLKAKIEFEKINKLKERYLVLDKVASLKKDEAVMNDFATNRYNNAG